MTNNKITTIEANGLLKNSEEDVYKQGCIPDTGGSTLINIHFTEKTIPKIIEEIKNYLGCSDENILRDSCGERGQINFQTYETREGYPATAHDFKLWKLGKKKLWLTCYIANVQRVTRQYVKV